MCPRALTHTRFPLLLISPETPSSPSYPGKGNEEGDEGGGRPEGYEGDEEVEAATATGVGACMSWELL